MMAKTRRRIVAKTSPMVAVAIDSSSKVSADSRTLSLARHVGKQSLSASMKVCICGVACGGNQSVGDQLQE